MNDSEKHDIALTASKYVVESNMPQYKGPHGFETLVTDLLSNYHQARKQIDATLPNLR